MFFPSLVFSLFVFLVCSFVCFFVCMFVCRSCPQRYVALDSILTTSAHTSIFIRLYIYMCFNVGLLCIVEVGKIIEIFSSGTYRARIGSIEQAESLQPSHKTSKTSGKPFFQRPFFFLFIAELILLTFYPVRWFYFFRRYSRFSGCHLAPLYFVATALCYDTEKRGLGSGGWRKEVYVHDTF